MQNLCSPRNPVEPANSPSQITKESCGSQPAGDIASQITTEPGKPRFLGLTKIPAGVAVRRLDLPAMLLRFSIKRHKSL